MLFLFNFFCVAHFDPVNINFYRYNKQFWGWPKWYISKNKKAEGVLHVTDSAVFRKKIKNVEILIQFFLDNEKK